MARLSPSWSDVCRRGGGRTNADNGTTDNAESCRFILFLLLSLLLLSFFPSDRFPCAASDNGKTRNSFVVVSLSSSSRGSSLLLFIYLFVFVCIRPGSEVSNKTQYIVSRTPPPPRPVSNVIIILIVMLLSLSSSSLLLLSWWLYGLDDGALYRQ